MVLKKREDGVITGTGSGHWDDVVDFLGYGRNRYPASYVIFEDGGMYYAQNGETGELEFSGAVPSTVINDTLGACGSGDLVVVKDDFQATTTITVPAAVTLTGAARTTVTVSDTADPVFNLAEEFGRLENFKIDMTGSTQRIGVRVAEDFCRIYDIDVFYGGTGIKVDADDGSEIFIENCRFSNASDYLVHYYRTTTTDTGGTYFINCLMGNGDPAVTTTIGLYVESTVAACWAYVWFIDSVIDGVRGQNTVRLENVYQIRFKDSWLTSKPTLTGAVFHAENCKDVFIDDTWFSYGATGTALDITDVDGFDVIGCHFDLNADRVFSFTGACYAINLKNNKIYNHAAPQHTVHFADAVTVDRVSIDNNMAVARAHANDYFIYRGVATAMTNITYDLNNLTDITNFINTPFAAGVERVGFENGTLKPHQGLQGWSGTSAGTNLTAGNYYVPNGVDTTGNAAEFNGSLRIRGDGRIKKLNVELGAAPGVGTSRTFTVRKNGANTALTVTISDADMEEANDADEVEFVDLDQISIHHTVAGAPAASSARWGVALELDAWYI